MRLTHVPDLDSLELLIRVASTGSLGQAATEHGISQPAVSARVKSMERLVGFPLVTRSARGSTLTTEGSLLADWARDVLHAAGVLEAGIGSLRHDRQVRLRVAASLTVAEHLVPLWLVRLAARRPETAVSLTALNSADVAARVLDRAADLGFVEGPRIPPGLDSQTVARDQLVVVVPPGHPWAKLRRPLLPETLAATRLVQREPASGTRTALEMALAPWEPLATPLLELANTSALRSAVAAGAGPAVLSELAVADDVTAGRVVRVAVRDVDLTRELRAVWPRGQRPTGSARDLLAIATH
ncbi:LysR family transcriptional regulator [Cellulomonas sp. URHE0023]|uniref:LysR family transcriptional regulator n=1 Tax=Cellulomonas sp. URHE0023 TaxID=1380354 RepID=UPI0004885C62|nr:LysR family transcriptional regulator [Cellulomonas sp. URHE0023]